MQGSKDGRACQRDREISSANVMRAVDWTKVTVANEGTNGEDDFFKLQKNNWTREYERSEWTTTYHGHNGCVTILYREGVVYEALELGHLVTIRPNMGRAMYVVLLEVIIPKG